MSPTPSLTPRPTYVAHTLHDRLHPIAHLHPHPLNARRRSERAKAELRTSLEQHGQYRTVVARRLPDGTIQLLAGHGTIEAMRDLGYEWAAVEVHDQVDDERAARIVAVDNRTSDLAEYDDGLLAKLLGSLPDLSGTGYSDADLAELEAVLAIEAGPTSLTDPDDAPSRPVSPVSRPGDVWLLGPHRLAVGDATDADVCRAALGGHLADLLLTDPPYNVDYQGGTAEQLTIANDHMDDASFGAFLLGLFSAALEHTKPGGPAYVFHADTEGRNFRAGFEEAGWELKQVLVWVKDQLVLGRQDHHWQHEPILYGWRPGAAHAWFGGRTLTTVLDDAGHLDPSTMSKAQLVELLAEALEESTVVRHARPKRNAEHPTMKPVALLERLIVRSTRGGGRVLDLCAGSGSTLIACHLQARVAALVEIDERYADVICRRWQEHTGTLPVLEATGQEHDFTSKAA